jgi:3-oxoacyl-[acyl-carrier-protein] synthase III
MHLIIFSIGRDIPNKIWPNADIEKLLSIIGRLNIALTLTKQRHIFKKQNCYRN